jgi:urease accessory protein
VALKIVAPSQKTPTKAIEPSIAMKANRPSPSAFLVTTVLMLVPVLAQAHPGHNGTGFTHGFIHPLSGLDHLLAMFAVGLWAAQLGGRALWAVPAAFLSVMVLGGALGMAHLQIPFIEQGILLSVLVLGVLIAAAVRLPLGVSMAIVGLFALCHGIAHGAEMPENAAGFAYGAGFVLTTALLHASGMAAGLMAKSIDSRQWLRFAGAGIAMGGVMLCVH